jgi:TP901 family phage tail tape measure protein
MPDVTVATLKTVFTADTADFERGKRKVESGLTDVGGKISGIGDGFKSAGTSLSLVSAPLIGAFGGAVMAAADFDEQLRNIQSVTGETDGQIAALGDTILGMESKFSNVELATTFYDVAGGVTDATKRLDVFNTAIDVATAGNANLQATTQAIIGTVNAFGISAEYAGDILTRTVGMGVGTMDQYAAALPGISGIASSVGVSFREVAAAAAYLTTKGFTAGEASTQLEAAMTALLNPNQAMTDAFEAAGIQSGSLALEQLGLVGTLDLLNEAFDGNVDAMTKAFGSKEALGAALGLAGEDVEAFFEAFDSGVKGATDTAAEAQKKSAKYQWGVLMNSFSDIAIIIGQELLPVLIDLGQDILPVAKAFAGFIKDNPKLVKIVAALAIGIGALGIAFTVLGSILGVVGTVFGIVLSPIFLVVAGIAALAAGIYFLTGGSLGELIGLFESAAAAIGKFAGGLMEAFQSGGLEGAATFINDNLVTPIKNFLNETDWSAVADTVWTRIKSALTTAVNAVDWGAVAETGFQALIDYWNFQLNLAWDAATFIYNKILIPLGTAIDNADWGQIARDAVSAIFDGIDLLIEEWNASPWVQKNIKTPLSNAITNLDLTQIGKDLWAGFKGALEAGITGFIDFHVFIYDNIIKPVMDELGIASPSTVFYTIGENVVQGLVNALLVGTFNLINAVMTWGPALLASFLAGLGDLGAWIQTNAIDPMVNALNGAVGSFGSAASAIASAVTGPFDSIIGKAMEVLDKIGLVNSSSGHNNPWAAAVTATQSAVNNARGGNQTPGRALGGPVMAGSPYIVGEKGPELFVPGQSGTIIPNGVLEGGGRNGGNNEPPIHIDAIYIYGIPNPRETLDLIVAEAKRRGRSPIVLAGNS